jgi:cation:H+ antiporter
MDAAEGTMSDSFWVRHPWLTTWFPMAVTIAIGLPAAYVRITEPHLSVGLETAIFGLGILSAAFILGVAAEAAQVDISRSLALAFLAFIAVLPEYAVDLYFAWRAGEDIQYAHYAVANMTGGNRLLIGIGWPVVLLLFWFKGHSRDLVLPRHVSLEVVVLAAATLYSFLIPLKGNISLVDSVILLSMFAFYLWWASKHPVEEPELAGPAEAVGDLPKWPRRIVVLGLFAFAGGIILASAEPFAEGLIDVGGELGVDEFVLVQWIAPLASESPEFLAAAYLVWRGAAAAGMTALISSKVNQWTLLIATLPIAFSISLGHAEPLPMDAKQVEEVFLTAAQSAFAVVLIMGLRLSPWRAVPLFLLFMGQFIVSIFEARSDITWADEVRYGFAYTYLALAAIMLIVERRHILPLFRYFRE